MGETKILVSAVGADLAGSRARKASNAIFAFSAASIFRLVFFIVRSVYHDRTASASN